MAGVTAFSVEEFVAEPVLGKLDNGRKADLFAIANHYGIQVSVSLLKKELKAAVVEGLVERGVCRLPATVAVAVAVSAEEVHPEFRGGEAAEPRDVFNMIQNVVTWRISSLHCRVLTHCLLKRPLAPEWTPE